MMAFGGMVTAGSTARRRRWRRPSDAGEQLGDVRYETDFRSVYAKLLDQWLGVNSVPILNGDFRAGAPAIF
jgi:uncharacterized protein (DUF1501 family)